MLPGSAASAPRSSPWAQCRASPLQAACVARLGGVCEAEAHAHRLVALVPLHAAQGVVQLVTSILLRWRQQQGVGGRGRSGHKGGACLSGEGGGKVTAACNRSSLPQVEQAGGQAGGQAGPLNIPGIGLAVGRAPRTSGLSRLSMSMSLSWKVLLTPGGSVRRTMSDSSSTRGVTAATTAGCTGVATGAHQTWAGYLSMRGVRLRLHASPVACCALAVHRQVPCVTDTAAQQPPSPQPLPPACLPER